MGVAEHTTPVFWTIPLVLFFSMLRTQQKQEQNKQGGNERTDYGARLLLSAVELFI